MQPNNAIIQSTAVDLLQAIIARGEIDPLSVQVVEAVVVGKLYFCVHMNRLDLQNKLLHLLHSLISASTSNEDPVPRTTSGKQRQGDGTPDDAGAGPDSAQDVVPRGHSVNPLLIQTLVDGIAVQTNRPVLQHWLDFILMAVPQFQPALQAVVTPLNDCVCRQLLVSLADVSKASSRTEGYSSDSSCTTTDAELVMLLSGLERLVLLSLAYTSEAAALDDDPPVIEKSSSENSGLLGYVSNVFSSDNVQSITEDQLTVLVRCSFNSRSTNPGIRLALLDTGLCTKVYVYCI